MYTSRPVVVMITRMNSINAFIESGSFTLDSEGAQGENFIKIRRFLPDFKILSCVSETYLLKLD